MLVSLFVCVAAVVVSTGDGDDDDDYVDKRL